MTLPSEGDRDPNVIGFREVIDEPFVKSSLPRGYFPSTSVSIVLTAGSYLTLIWYARRNIWKSAYIRLHLKGLKVAVFRLYIIFRISLFALTV